MSETPPKLTDEQVQEILRLHAEGMGYKALSKRFPVNETKIRNICLGRFYNDGTRPMKPWSETSKRFGQGPRIKE